MMTIETNDYSLGLFDVPEEYSSFLEIFSIGNPNGELIQTPEKSIIKLTLDKTEYEVTLDNPTPVSLKAFLKSHFG